MFSMHAVHKHSHGERASGRASFILIIMRTYYKSVFTISASTSTIIVLIILNAGKTAINWQPSDVMPWTIVALVRYATYRIDCRLISHTRGHKRIPIDFGRNRNWWLQLQPIPFLLDEQNIVRCSKSLSPSSIIIIRCWWRWMFFRRIHVHYCHAICMRLLQPFWLPPPPPRSPPQ